MKYDKKSETYGHMFIFKEKNLKNLKLKIEKLEIEKNNTTNMFRLLEHKLD